MAVGGANPRTETAVVETSGETVEATRFREAMSRIAAAVHVVTTDGPAGRAGATMTAVSSVSDAPPTLLVCLNRSGRTGDVLVANGVFCVNVLVGGDEALAGAFAGLGGLDHPARFATASWQTGVTGAPILVGSRAALDCRVTNSVEVGSHTVVFGEVVDVHVGDRGAALLYLDRTWRTLKAGDGER
jgi:flavin reductase (DIM6/NTAB) family NADH-FMN oxidoreductase RutF